MAGRDVVSSAGVARATARPRDQFSFRIRNGATGRPWPRLSGNQDETNIRAEAKLVCRGSERTAGLPATMQAEDEASVSQTNQASGSGVLADPEVGSDAPDVGDGHESIVRTTSGFEGDVFEHRPRRWPEIGPSASRGVGDPQVVAVAGDPSATGS